MARYTSPSIDDLGGISTYLDSTKKDHNGYGSKDLIKNWRWGEGKHMNITALAIMFGVSWSTMRDWIERMHDEAKKPRVDRSEKTAS